MGCVRAPGEGSGAIAMNIDLLLQHHGRWLRVNTTRGKPAVRKSGKEWQTGARSLSSRSDARARTMLEEDIVEDEHVGAVDDVVRLSGADWYVLGPRGREVKAHAASQLVSSKQMTARTVVQLLDALTSQKREEAQVIINAVGIHSRMADSSQESMLARSGSALELAGNVNGTRLVNGHADRSGHAHLANGAGTPMPSNGYNSECPHVSHSKDSNGHGNAMSLGGTVVDEHGDDNSELRELGHLFEQALVVHRGKPGLEEHRPNPYVGDDLPPGLAAHLAARDSILSRPISEEKVPEFFSELLQHWHRYAERYVYHPAFSEKRPADAYFPHIAAWVWCAWRVRRRASRPSSAKRSARVQASAGMR